MDTGGKKSINAKRAGLAGGGTLLIGVTLMALLSPAEDQTFFVRANNSKGVPNDPEALTEVKTEKDKQVQTLLNNGSIQLAQEKKEEQAKKKKLVTIKYYASQVIGVTVKGPKTMLSGSKLLGFLARAVDTRQASLVRVVLPQGGVSPSGMEIQKGSILVGQFSYPGSGDKVYVRFARLDTPDSESMKVSATALDALDYTDGLKGEAYSDAGLKVAAGLGLSMASSMADVLTEKETMGFSATAKPTMKNALLQGVSHAAQDQGNRTSEEISSSKDYVVVPEGKEMIVELTEDFKK